MTPFVLLLGFAAALGDLIGGAIVATPRHISDRTLTLLMALGAGNLLGVSVIELIPESIKEVGESAPLYILGGYLLSTSSSTYSRRICTSGRRRTRTA